MAYANNSDTGKKKYQLRDAVNNLGIGSVNEYRDMMQKLGGDTQPKASDLRYGRVGNDNVNAGYFSGGETPWGRESGAYAHLGDLGLNSGVYQGQNPEYYASAFYDKPALYNMPSFEGSVNTPIGQFGLDAGGMADNFGVRGSYQPNTQAQTMARALLSLLGR